MTLTNYVRRLTLIGWKFGEQGPLAILDPGNGERGMILAPTAIQADPGLWEGLSPADQAEIEAGPQCTKDAA